MNQPPQDSHNPPAPPRSQASSESVKPSTSDIAGVTEEKLDRLRDVSQESSHTSHLDRAKRALLNGDVIQLYHQVQSARDTYHAKFEKTLAANPKTDGKNAPREPSDTKAMLVRQERIRRVLDEFDAVLRSLKQPADAATRLAAEREALSVPGVNAPLLDELIRVFRVKRDWEEQHIRRRVHDYDYGP